MKATIMSRESGWTRDFVEAIKAGDSSKVAFFLDGADYGYGQIEELQATCNNLRRSFAAMIVFMVDKKVMTPEEAAKVILL